MASKIIALLPKHTTYVEPFCGGAAVFYRKKPSQVEVLNDLDGEVVNFLRVCQWHYEELIRFMRYMVVSRTWFGLLAKTDPATLTDIQRAGRYLYLQKNCFGGLVIKQHFHYGVVQRPNFNPERLPEILARAHERLQHVQLESLPYEQILERYDRPHSAFYIDPPYLGPKLYRYNFAEADFVRLAERLCALQGKFILSINDRPEIRRIFQAFLIRPIEVVYSARQNARQRYTELLITNFEPTKIKTPGQGKYLIPAE